MPVPPRAAAPTDTAPPPQQAAGRSLDGLDDGLEAVRRPVVSEVRPLFVLAFNPLGWRPVPMGPKGEREWLPEIMEIPLTPGANGMVTRLRDQDPDEAWRQAEAYLREQRRLFPLPRQLQVPASVLPAGQTPGTWWRRREVRLATIATPVVSYYTAWHVEVPGLPGEPVGFRLDQPTWFQFAKWLVDQGHVKADATFEAVRLEYERRCAQRVTRVESRLYPVRDVQETRVAAVRAELAAARETPAPRGVA